ncbi:MAG: hypothetical protein HY901_33480, partial [Deltaproteobacteria bacterium]|nr:hypothetical protein [Deltaproteobacteria bacterium]
MLRSLVLMLLAVDGAGEPLVIAESGGLGESRHVVEARLDGKAVRLPVVAAAPAAGGWAFDASRDCKLALIEQEKEWAIYVREIDRTEQRRLFSSAQSLSSPAFSPSGDSLAVVENALSWDDQKVLVLDMKGKVIAQTAGFVAGWLSEHELLVLRFVDVTKRVRPCFEVVRLDIRSKEQKVVQKTCGVPQIHASGAVAVPAVLNLKDGEWHLLSGGEPVKLSARPLVVPFPLGIDSRLFVFFK